MYMEVTKNAEYGRLNNRINLWGRICFLWRRRWKRKAPNKCVDSDLILALLISGLMLFVSEDNLIISWILIPEWLPKYFHRNDGNRKQAASSSRKNGTHWTSMTYKLIGVIMCLIIWYPPASLIRVGKSGDVLSNRDIICFWAPAIVLCVLFPRSA